jgi:hypothetical protein
VLQARHDSRERTPGFFDSQIANKPHAGIIFFQALLEIRHEHLDQIFFARVELADMRAPRHVEQGLIARDRKSNQAFGDQIQK